MAKGSLRSILAVALFLVSFAPARSHSETIKIAGTGGAMGTVKMLAETFQRSRPDIQIQVIGGLGSSGAKKALLQGAIDIAVTSKAGSAPEIVPGAAAVEYGRSPFVFITSKANPVSGVTSRQILDIYAGRLLTWPNGNRLRLVLRPATDSDTDMLRTMSPEMVEAVESALAREGLPVALTAQDGADAIESIPGALGTSTLALILSETRSLKALALDRATPDPRSIADGTYPYFKSFHFVTTPKFSGAGGKFISFALSPEGAKVLSRSGHWVVGRKTSR